MLLNEYNRLQVNPLLNPKPLSFKCKHLFLMLLYEYWAKIVLFPSWLAIHGDDTTATWAL